MIYSIQYKSGCLTVSDLFHMFTQSINGAITLEIYSTFYHNNYGNYIFIADTQCDRYIFYVNESIQICMISGETLPVKADFHHAWRRD